MITTYYVIYICSVAIANQDCNEKNARAYISHVEQGLVCGSTMQIGPIVNSATAPQADEYLKITCRIEKNR